MKQVMPFFTVDREIFAVKKFSPVAWAAKIKYTYTRFIVEPSGGENETHENLKCELFLPLKFPDLRYMKQVMPFFTQVSGTTPSLLP